jgi:hypothetical protein
MAVGAGAMFCPRAAPNVCRMINYTQRITRVMHDVVRRTPALSFIDLREVLVFARYGRTDADGAFATCHCLTLPETEPGYYFWKDRQTGELTRRSEWFITKTPEVRVAGTRIKYLISFVLPRFCQQRLDRSWKAEFYSGADPWVAKLDTIIHELYHIDPLAGGIRQFAADGARSARTHGPEFYESVASMTRGYLASRPDPALFEFLKMDFGALQERYGGVAATTFRNFPSFPQRYMAPCETLSADEPTGVKIEPLKRLTQPVLYTERDLNVRQFTHGATVRLLSA